MVRTARFVFGCLVLSATQGTGSAQVDVPGCETVPVAQLDIAVSLIGRNATGREICDFTLRLADACGVDLNQVTVTSMQPGGAGDWDVDDDLDGASQGVFEEDDFCLLTGVLARADALGGGDETAPQDAPGRCIGPGELFRVDVAFVVNAAQACDLRVCPSSARGFQLATGTLPGGLVLGSNDVVLENATLVVPGASSALVNQTGFEVSGWSFRAPLERWATRSRSTPSTARTSPRRLAAR